MFRITRYLNSKVWTRGINTSANNKGSLNKMLEFMKEERIQERAAWKEEREAWKEERLQFFRRQAKSAVEVAELKVRIQCSLY